MDSELVVLHYESPAAAEGAMATIHGLVAEGFVELEDAAFISRDADGWVTVKPADSGEPARHAAFGGALGLLAGGLMGLPVLGVLAGAGVAAKMSSHADHLEELISSVGRQMTA
ncbi:MAG: hypothetical protein OEU32_19530, partial [Acidimicrobiia bacterium]|nr:hypothetical protein [Acidimicrobiia bacterium]